ncbi:hypothetical protein ACVWXO_007359 [Bradyrhizobium sp. LM2.7]
MCRSLLVPVAILLLVVPAARWPAAADASVGVVIDDFSYTDTSAEPANQTAAHERRLAAFMAALRRHITADGRYRLAPSVQDGAAFKVIGRHPEDEHAGAMGQGCGDRRRGQKGRDG